MDMNGMNDSEMPGMHMEMYFHTGFMEYILFEGAHTTTKGEFAGACVVVVVWTVLYELLKHLRQELIRRQQAQRAELLQHSSPEEKAVINSPVRQIFSQVHVLQTVLHMVQVFMSYCLMLVFMTYNVYLALCVLIGSGLGYFAVGWRRPQLSDQNEHCH